MASLFRAIAPLLAATLLPAGPALGGVIHGQVRTPPVPAARQDVTVPPTGDVTADVTFAP